MNMNSFRTEAIANPPVVIDYDYDNEEEGDRSAMESLATTPNMVKRTSTRKKKDGTPDRGGEQKSDTILEMENMTGHIDVWWLFDDGGKKNDH